MPQRKTLMSTDSKCVFCGIVAGDEPASKFYEDDELLGFMNYKPVHPGECLLIPKAHIDHFMDIDNDLAARMMKLGQQLSRRIRERINPDRVGYVVAGYGVPHAHLIVIPNYHANDITCEHFAVLKEGRIVFTDEHIPIASRDELDRMAALLRIGS
jgi:histidine triad (HIT) family protein